MYTTIMTKAQNMNETTYPYDTKQFKLAIRQAALYLRDADRVGIHDFAVRYYGKADGIAYAISILTGIGLVELYEIIKEEKKNLPPIMD